MVDGLLERGWEVTALLMEWEKDVLASRPEVAVVVGSLGEVEAGMIPAGSVVFHLAAKVHTTAQSAEQEREFFEVNTEGTARLATAAAEAGAAGFVLVSTIAVYGEQVSGSAACDEETSLEPVSPYGRSKAAAEERVAALLEGRVAWVVVRPCVVYGPGDRGNFARLVRAAKKGRVPVIGGGRARKNTLYVKNLARVLEFVGANAAELSGRALNVADSEAHTMREIIDAIGRALGREVKVRNLPVCLLRPLGWVGDAVGKLAGREMPISSRRIRVLTTDSVVSTRRLEEVLAGRVELLDLEAGLADYLGGEDQPAG